MRHRLVAVALAGTLAGGCYKSTPMYRGITGASFAPNGTELVQVGQQREANVVAGEGGGATVEVGTRPICAPVTRGQLLVTETATYDKDDGLKVMAPLTAGVAALIGGVLMLAKGPSVMTKPEVGLFVGGTLALGVGLMFVPSKKRTETKQVYTAATIDPDGSTWRSCGERTPEQAAIDLRFSGGWKSFTESVQTGMDGRYTLEGELLEDVLTWSGACQQELTMAVDLPKTGDTTADALRAREGEIATDPGAPRASELQRYLGGARDGHHLELGFAAGGRTTGVFSTATRNVTYRLKAGAPLARPSTRSSPAVALARSCRADQKRDCVTTARKEVAGRCEAECTSKEKRQLCQVKREICDEQTAGIGGSLGQQCKAQLEACLVDEKQDDTSVGACRNSCETRLASERCAG